MIRNQSQLKVQGNLIQVPGTSMGNKLQLPNGEGFGNPMFVGDAAVASTKTFLSTELERYDNLIRRPLRNYTYMRDININVNNGLDWAELISYKSVDYGITNGAHESPVNGGKSTEIPVIQADISKDYFRTHLWEVAMRINYFDLARGDITDYSIQQALQEGLREAYDMHLNSHVYIGMPQYNTFGLLNQPSVTPITLPNGANGSNAWETMTPQEIIAALNLMITTAIQEAAYDPSAYPNHISLPFSLFNYLISVGSSDFMSQSINGWFVANNFVNANGEPLTITWNVFGETAGEGGTRRIAVYNDNRRFLGLDILAPLTRIMFDSNTEKVSYDSLYASNISEVMLFYPQTMHYFDLAAAPVA